MDKVMQQEYTESKPAILIPKFIRCLNCFDSGDLVGLKVSHDFAEMEDGDAHILTLKDSRILENEGTSVSLFELMASLT